MNAVIFDMDGVIVDSEPFWQRAEKEVFTALGVEVKAELCQLTQRMTTTEVTKFWFKRNPWKGKTIEEVEELVVLKVIELIEKNDCIIPGITSLVKRLKKAGYKVGLATNSPYRIIPRVLAKAQLSDCFDVISSAEFVAKGKPAPDVYLKVLEELEEEAHHCIAIEDSNSGIIAAKQAGIKVIAFKNKHQNKILETTNLELQQFEGIDFSIFH